MNIPTLFGWAVADGNRPESGSGSGSVAKMHHAGQSLWRSALASEDVEEAGVGDDPAPSRSTSQKARSAFVKRLPTPDPWYVGFAKK